MRESPPPTVREEILAEAGADRQVRRLPRNRPAGARLGSASAAAAAGETA